MHLHPFSSITTPHKLLLAVLTTAILLALPLPTTARPTTHPRHALLSLAPPPTDLITSAGADTDTQPYPSYPSRLHYSRDPYASPSPDPNPSLTPHLLPDYTSSRPIHNRNAHTNAQRTNRNSDASRAASALAIREALFGFGSGSKKNKPQSFCVDLNRNHGLVCVDRQSLGVVNTKWCGTGSYGERVGMRCSFDVQ
ncbi:hypothetical protein MMC19_005654 [Ptychographa xylographoides]|nr:hypothetical protein [Ptychographa xylographoides]